MSLNLLNLRFQNLLRTDMGKNYSFLLLKPEAPCGEADILKEFGIQNPVLNQVQQGRPFQFSTGCAGKCAGAENFFPAPFQSAADQEKDLNSMFFGKLFEKIIKKCNFVYIFLTHSCTLC